eukprot:750506-Hanusia_phi.AAC.4
MPQQVQRPPAEGLGVGRPARQMPANERRGDVSNAKWGGCLHDQRRYRKCECPGAAEMEEDGAS